MRFSRLSLSLLAGLTLVAATPASAQVSLALRAGGTSNDPAADVTPDGSGGAFVVGSFIEASDFDDDGAADVTSAGIYDAYVARYDADGDLVFATSVGGTLSDYAQGVASDGAGGAFVVGTYRGAIDADGDGTPDLNGTTSDDHSFLARYDGAGTLAYIVPVGGFGTLRVEGLVSDGAGGVYVTGDFAGSADFDGDNTPDFASAGQNDIFVARYDAAGDLVFARRMGGTFADYGEAVVPDGAGGLFVTGSFDGAADFDDDGTADIASVGGADLFVARYDAAGDLVFVSGGGGTNTDEGLALASDGAGGAFVTGAYRGAPDFDGDGTADLPSASSFGTAFIARYDAAGDLVFVTSSRAPSGPGTGLAADGAGGVLATGLFFVSTDFDGDGTRELFSAGDSDVYLVRLGPTGALVSASRLGGPSTDRARALAVDAQGRTLVAGEFLVSLDVDDDGAADLVSAGRDDTFLVRVEGLAVDAEPAAAQGRLALAVAPNPSAGNATIRLHLNAPGAAVVTLYDALGRTVSVLHDGALAASDHTFALPSLSPGVYVVRAAGAGVAVSRTLTVVR